MLPEILEVKKIKKSVLKLENYIRRVPHVFTDNMYLFILYTGIFSVFSEMKICKVWQVL
jgi:hypothetical protein